VLELFAGAVELVRHGRRTWGVLFRKDADNASGNFVADYSLVVPANDIDSKFPGGHWRG